MGPLERTAVAMESKETVKVYVFVIQCYTKLTQGLCESKRDCRLLQADATCNC